MEEWYHRNPGREPSPRGGGGAASGPLFVCISLVNQLISTVRRQHKTDSINTNKKKVGNEQKNNNNQNKDLDNTHSMSSAGLSGVFHLVTLFEFAWALCFDLSQGFDCGLPGGFGGGRWMQTGLGADVDRDVGVKGQVLPWDYLVFGCVHSVHLPGLTRLGEHVEPSKGEVETEENSSVTFASHSPLFSDRNVILCVLSVFFLPCQTKWIFYRKIIPLPLMPASWFPSFFVISVCLTCRLTHADFTTSGRLVSFSQSTSQKSLTGQIWTEIQTNWSA